MAHNKKQNGLAIFLLLFASGQELLGQNFGNGFNFYMPPSDSASVRFLPAFPKGAIGERDFVTSDANGHFSVQGRTLRFFGVNFAADAAFPTKSKAQAIAGRLRKMGFNLVRLHHLDNPWSRESLFEQGQDTRHLNPITLDRLENLIAALKQNGIYINMNLHVSRTFSPRDGVPEVDSLPEFGKAVNYFDPQILALHKEYARQLLTHLNPYTGLRLAQDPVLAMVEITNENSLYRSWRDGMLKPFARGGQLTVRHNAMLDRLWQEYLLAKYGDTANLAESWNVGVVTPAGNDQVRNGRFENAPVSSGWSLEQHEGAQATMVLDPINPFAGRYSARVQVSRVTGTDWHLQWKQVGLSVTRDSAYTVTFAARADSTRRISVAVMRDVAPWNSFSWSSIQLTPAWKTYTVSFTSGETVGNVVRLSFGLGEQKGAYWFDDLSFTRAATQGLLAGESLESGNLRRLEYAECASFTDGRVRDLSAFYLKLQSEYYREMIAFLKNELQVRVPISGTNWNVGPADLSAQATADYLDNHAYWDHPSFPNQPWSPTDWLINNNAMVQSSEGGAIAGVLAGVPMSNKPFTISEYNHAFPNRYQTEGVLFLSAYAAFHDIDGLMFFDYNVSATDWESDFIGGYFSISRNAAIMALMPACAFAYRQGLVAKARQTLAIAYAPDDYLLLPKRDDRSWSGPAPFNHLLALQHAVRVSSFDGALPFDPAKLPAAPNPPFTSDTGEIRWDVNGLLSVATPQFVAAAGYLQNFAGVRLGYLTLEHASDFGAVTWLSISGDSLPQAQLSLLTLSTRAQNTGMVWDGIHTVHNQWGRQPTQLQPLQASLRLNILADSLRLYPLDANGRETKGYVTHRPTTPNQFELEIDQQEARTLWFGIEAIGDGEPTAIAAPLMAAPFHFELMPGFPNPFNPSMTIRFVLPQREYVTLKVFNSHGQEVATVIEKMVDAGQHEVTFAPQELAGGVYFYSLTAGNFKQTRKATLIK